MKISKRVNGSYVLRVGLIEATISGSQTIKEVYDLCDKLSAVVGKVEEEPKKKEEPKKVKKPKLKPEPKPEPTPEPTPEETDDEIEYQVVEEKQVKTEMSRPELILNTLKKHGPLPAGEIAEKTGLTTTQFYGAVPNLMVTKRIKRKQTAEGWIYMLPKSQST